MAVKKDAINIAPFVDILLVLFVILVAASSFSDSKSLDSKIEHLKSNLLDKDKEIRSLKQKLKSEKDKSVLELKGLKKRLKKLEERNNSLAKNLKKYREKESLLKKELESIKKKKPEHKRTGVDEKIVKRLKSENKRLEKIVENLQKRLENAGNAVSIYVYPSGEFEVNGVKVKKKELKKFIEIFKPNINVYWPKHITPKAEVSLELLKDWYEKSGGVFKWRR